MLCKYVKLKLDRYIQGDLPDWVSKKIARHVSSCQGCADALSRIRKLEGLLEDTSIPPIPEDFTERLMQRAYKQSLQKASEPKIIRIWERFGRADLKKAAVAAGIIIGLSVGLLMGLQTSRQSYKTQVVASSALVDAYHFDYLTEAPENSLSSVYMRMVSGGNNFEE
jgi:anti-sigma factor RsiW